MEEVENFTAFVRWVSYTTRRFVEQIPPSSVRLPEGLLERMEFRNKSSLSTDDMDEDEEYGLSGGGAEVATKTQSVKSESGEEAIVEGMMNTVRLSVRIAWSGDEKCHLSQTVQSLFYTRLARSSGLSEANLVWLRREAVKGYDVSFIFTPMDLGRTVEEVLMEVLPVWRKVTKQVRVKQLIEHRRSGVALFGKLVGAFAHTPSASATLTPVDSPDESRGLMDVEDALSVATECGHMGSIKELEDMMPDQATESLFII